VDLQEQKQKARLLEQQGDTAGALGLCEVILSQIEGTQEIWRELPLYVKAGDLSLKLGDSGKANSHYEKAARAYAAYGSSKSVLALCAKILRVNPGSTHIFLRLVRIMIEREHLAEARNVLAEYATRMKLPKSGAALERFVDSSPEQMKPALEMILELGGRYEYARAQGRDDQAEQERAAEDGDSSSDETEKTTLETATERDTEPTVGSDVGAAGSGDEGDWAESRADDAEEETELISAEAVRQRQDDDPEAEPQASEEDSTDAAADAPDDSEVQWVEDVRPSMRVSQARGSRRVLFSESQPKKRSRALWVGLIAAVVVVVGGLSLILFEVIPFGGGGGPQELNVPPSVPQSDSASAETTDSTDTESAADEGMASTEIPTPVETPDAAGRAPALAEEPAAEAAPSDPGEDSVAQTLDESTQTAVADAPDSVAEPDDSAAAVLDDSRNGIMVRGLAMDTSSQFEVDGRPAYRVVQFLNSGARLILTSVYYGNDIDSAPGSEEVTLAPLAGDTTIAIIQFEGYAVEARALATASQLESLLTQLVEVPPAA